MTISEKGSNQSQRINIEIKSFPVKMSWCIDTNILMGAISTRLQLLGDDSLHTASKHSTVLIDVSHTSISNTGYDFISTHTSRY